MDSVKHKLHNLEMLTEPLKRQFSPLEADRIRKAGRGEAEPSRDRGKDRETALTLKVTEGKRDFRAGFTGGRADARGHAPRLVMGCGLL